MGSFRPESDTSKNSSKVTVKNLKYIQLYSYNSNRQ